MVSLGLWDILEGRESQFEKGLEIYKNLTLRYYILCLDI